MITKTLRKALYIVIFALANNANASVSIKTEHSIFANISIIDIHKIKEVISDSLMDELQSEKLSVKIRGFEQGVQLQQKHELFNVSIIEPSFNKRSRRFNYTLAFEYGKYKELKTITGSYEEIVSIPTLSSRIPHNTLIRSSDIDYMEIAKHRLRHDTITSADDLIGKTLKSTKSPMRPIRERNLINQQIVSRSSNIKISYKTPSITLTASGVAMEGGAKGDLIRIRNTNSNKIIQAVIKNSNLAVILAENL